MIKKEDVLVIDGRNFLYISVYALHRRLGFTKSLEDYTEEQQAIFLDKLKGDLLYYLNSMLHDFKCTSFYFVIDGTYSFRKHFFDGYKDNRDEKPYLIRKGEELLLTTWSKEFQWKILSQNGMEGDDWMAVITRDKTKNYFLATGDEDMHMLTHYDNVHVISIVKRTVFSSQQVDIPSGYYLQIINGMDVAYEKLWMGCKSDLVPKILPKGKGEKAYKEWWQNYDSWLRNSYEEIGKKTFTNSVYFDIDPTLIYRNFELTCLLHEYHDEILKSKKMEPKPFVDYLNKTQNNFFI